MKKNELKKCAECGKGMMHSGNPIFYRVAVERMCVNLPAVERHHGLELMLGRNAALASVMGPDEDIAVPLGARISVLVCQDCSIKLSVAHLAELPEDSE
jgi:hypothetical protein